MALRNVLAGVAVKDLEAAVDWYGRLLARAADRRPMDGLAEWDFPTGGVLQLFDDAERAGRSSITLVEDDVEGRVAALADMGVTLRDRMDGDFTVLIIDDPDGNRVVFAEPRR